MTDTEIERALGRKRSATWRARHPWIPKPKKVPDVHRCDFASQREYHTAWVRARRAQQ